MLKCLIGVSKWCTLSLVLGPTLFLIYINDIDVDTVCHVLHFADDTKIIRKMGNEEDATQSDLQIMFEWSKEWQMLFNMLKYKVLHVGRSRP